MKYFFTLLSFIIIGSSLLCMEKSNSQEDFEKKRSALFCLNWAITKNPSYFSSSVFSTTDGEERKQLAIVGHYNNLRTCYNLPPATSYVTIDWLWVKNVQEELQKPAKTETAVAMIIEKGNHKGQTIFIEPSSSLNLTLIGAAFGAKEPFYYGKTTHSEHGQAIPASHVRTQTDTENKNETALK